MLVVFDSEGLWGTGAPCSALLKPSVEALRVLCRALLQVLAPLLWYLQSQAAVTTLMGKNHRCTIGAWIFHPEIGFDKP
eukprot:7770425-Pyramimonas_sp.AAC.2